ncbi:uncharacterized protein LOC132276230 [Cornus florida]|uniref:uncharacterized protein LOC132276230 n=1 Tax=Cornus florida TaxID=4283 RepID=UPI002896C5F6|nr:uncharacterized protein LOC132276230 [Cornus florida]
MANWTSFGDRMLNFHRSMLKSWCNCSGLKSFQYSSTRRGGGLLLGGGCLKKAAHFSPMGRRHCSSSPTPPPVSTPSPLLFVPPGVSVVDQKNSDEYSDKDYFHFFSLSEQSQFRVPKSLRIPWQRDLLTPDAAPCVGSSHGWLAFNHPRNCHPYLYNPLMDTPDFPYVPLPSVETLPSVAAVRLLKSDHLSPSPPLIKQFLIFLHDNERNVSTEDISHFYVRRLVMSSPPSLPCYSSSPCGNDCTIMAIHSASEDIAFCKPGDHSWTTLDTSVGPYIDIIYFSKDQRFYAMRSYLSIEAWDLTDPSCPKKHVFDNPLFCPGKFEEGKIAESYNCDETDYLVESSGDLLLVSRFIAVSVTENGIPHPRRLEKKIENNNGERENCFLHDDDAYWTLGFDVHRFDFDHNKWEPVECLGDRALFVGSNNSFSLSTLNHPELMGNSIYFTDDYFDGFNKIYRGHDNGVFHLEDHCIKPSYPRRLKIIDPHPVWIAPSTM